MRKVVLSFYDYTGEAVRPWAEQGYDCHIFDIQHPEFLLVFDAIEEVGEIGGTIQKLVGPDLLGARCACLS